MLRLFVLPHSLPYSHRTSQFQTGTSLGVAQGLQHGAGLSHGIWTGGGYLALPCSQPQLIWAAQRRMMMSQRGKLLD